MFNVQCSMFNVQCSMFNVQCLMFNVQCSWCLLFSFPTFIDNGQWSVFRLLFWLISTCVQHKAASCCSSVLQVSAPTSSKGAANTSSSWPVPRGSSLKMLESRCEMCPRLSRNCEYRGRTSSLDFSSKRRITRQASKYPNV